MQGARLGDGGGDACRAGWQSVPGVRRLFTLHPSLAPWPAEADAGSSDKVAGAATTIIAVLAVVGVLVGGGATIKYFFM